MRVLAVSDLHQRKSLLAQLGRAVDQHRPEVVAVVGDFLDGMEPQDGPGMITAAECARHLSALSAEVVIVPGNHDDLHWNEFQAAWGDKPLNALNGGVYQHGPLLIVGFPCLTGSDEHYRVGRRVRTYDPDLWLHSLLQAHPPARTLWLMHEPPSSKLAAEYLFQREWAAAVREYQPLLTVSGHDHVTVLERNTFYARSGRTLMLNAGQRVYPVPGTLCFFVIDFEFPGHIPSLPARFRFSRFG